jgi:hypothetical protein
MLGVNGSFILIYVLPFFSLKGCGRFLSEKLAFVSTWVREFSIKKKLFQAGTAVDLPHLYVNIVKICI